MTPTLNAAGRERCPSRERPIDLVHLARQTGGSRQLEREVLGLMARHVEQAMERVAGAPARDLAALAHAVTGAARNVGAFPLAEAARLLGERPDEMRAREAFQSEAGRVLAFIRTLDGRDGALTAGPALSTCAA